MREISYNDSYSYPIVTEMQVFPTTLCDVLLIQPRRYEDSRGWFAEVFNANAYAEAGLPANFVQDNQSNSTHGVLRGLHYQLQNPQGKLVRVLSGHIWDVAVDLRRASPTFGRWEGFHLQSQNAVGEMQLLWIPEGFAHGFMVLSKSAEVLYKTTQFYDPSAERCIVWNDTSLGIEWPLDALTTPAPTVSSKDASGMLFADAEMF
jgi:dTDP-4-dehydrorhamnose 3,5-epimerase